MGDRLLRWLEVKGVSLTDLAKAAKVSVSAAHYWVATGRHGGDGDKKGKPRRTRPSLQHIERAVARLGITMEQFYGPLPEQERRA